MGQVAADVFVNSIKGFLAPIWHLLEDEKVTEVMINGPDDIWVEVAGKVKKSDAKFPDEDALQAAVNNIAQSVGRTVSEQEPRLDARLPNGYRIHAVLPPCARNGTTVAIRKFSKVQITLKQYVEWGALTVDAAQFLDLSMKLGKNILVSGGTGSGKTTLLGLLCNRIPSGQRVIVIEDASELSIEYEHVVFFETQMGDEQGRGEVSITDLVKSSLRLRPDRIIVGEVRGDEALDLIQAMNTGHKGCLGTVHANSSSDALVRLEALAQGAEGGISEKALRHQIGSAIDLIVQVSRYSDGSRRVAEISEVVGFDEDGNYDVRPIYELRRLLKGEDGRLHGQIEPSGTLPTFMQEIEDNKIPFPRSKFG
ncbi:MAG: CpaF family protein [Pseudobdellovibrionaceae bacterium]|nr:MAG: CpaF family protein [Pseudobdellovibrionaceae bacterium]